MEYCHNLFMVFILLSIIASCGSYASVPTEEYWKAKFPNTPMPESLKSFVKPGTSTSSYIGADEPADYETASYGPRKKDLYNVNETAYFFEKNLAVGNKMRLRFRNPVVSRFMSRQAADSLPFSSAKIPEILKHFSVKPDSKEAEYIKDAIEECEEPPIKGERKYCATSLESMIDFTVSRLGKNIKVLSTEVDRKVVPVQEFTIVGVSKLLKSSSIACHKLKYAYAVHYCHENHEVRLYAVPLKAADGTKFTAYSVCHINTSDWSPMHVAFQLLNIKPGRIPVCHFLARDTLLWVPNI